MADESVDPNRSDTTPELLWNVGDETEVIRPVSESPFTAVIDPMDDNMDALGKVKVKKKRLIWPWIVLAVVLVLGAATAGGWWFFESHALPGVSLWGNSMVGKSRQQIINAIDDQVNNTAVPVEYNGETASFTLKELGYDIDSEEIADQVVNAKRDGAWWKRYLPNEQENIEPDISLSVADGSVIDEALGTAEVTPVDAQVTLNADGNGFDVVPMQLGKGADAQAVAEQGIAAVESLGDVQPQTVTIELKDTEPAVTDTIANEAKATLDGLVSNPVEIKVNDHTIATIDAPALAASMTINANEQAKLADNETRNGYVVFNADKMQEYYNNSIKTNLQTGREDREVVVNNNGEELEVVTEGHDGVTVADGADTNIGPQLVEALANGGGSVSVEGTVDPMQTKTTKRHVVVDLSDNKVYAYENDQLIRTMSMSAGQGNSRTTGECVSGGDLCTPTGDFTIWLKYESQDMSGNLTLSDGSTSQWDVKGVGFVNYFSRSGCAIHRIATSGYVSDAAVAAMGNTSHGCVGIGWDQAEWFYNWCVMGTTVHVQV
ncbi:L,D-transpeptidase catalytic domain-containing protein [Bifidobacterium lemurum]|uniref:L,D-transpeptidase catalytic domain-containing protein n=1 Tax=Bifidobacterium lemurum TaxID=1603886 RepID=A0A261FN16_9BIFI|nr:L,D-transpeptidase family protein [Bifidobacterium lemurum]OZG60216.1 L,D-transpeptidase catalytic domain-containing protein [Bifidobacterium lemurum]QOL34113.1 L,D-transpeptidase family protein [Bifidobacterium lemurum]